MKKLIITTIILLAAVVAVTVVYFKNLNSNTASSTGKVMESIPNTAALVFEFSNDAGFYDIFTGNELLTEVIGKQKMTELELLRSKILLEPLLKKYFDDQHVYISLHGQRSDTVDLLITMAGSALFNRDHLTQLVKTPRTGMHVSEFKADGKDAYAFTLDSIKRTFYLINKGSNVFSGSFSRSLALQTAAYRQTRGAMNFLQIPDQQNNNSLANLYINYQQLTPLFDMFFRSSNSPVLRTLRMMPALGALSINYRTDALIFNGYTNVAPGKPISYATIFRNQQPVPGKLKAVLPSTTAISTCFALSDVKKFTADLDNFHKGAGLESEKNKLFKTIKNETGLALLSKFNDQLSGEFAMITTRFDEKFAVVPIKNGQATRQLMVSISDMVTDDVGKFRYDKLPFFLLGDAFSELHRPYFMILDDQLILANSQNELNSFKDSYDNNKFLNKMEGYQKLDELVAERSNVSYLINFRNLYPLLKRDMKPSFAALFDPDKSTSDGPHSLSWQLSAAEGNFYVNFCLTFNN